MLKFVTNLPPKQEGKPVKLTLQPASSGNTNEYKLIAEDVDGNKAAVLGVRGDGTVVLYIGQQKVLRALGFQVDESRGTINLYNS